MTYACSFTPTCKKDIESYGKKNPVLLKALRNKMAEIAENPDRYKSLRHSLSGEFRVHILKSFVLKYDIDEQSKTVIFLAFSHHDDAYRR